MIKIFATTILFFILAGLGFPTFASVQTQKSNTQTFSDVQITRIKNKINLSITQQNNTTPSNTYTQGKYKAQYFSTKDYRKNTDTILITIDKKQYKIEGAYGEVEKKKFLEKLKEGHCKDEKGKLMDPSYAECGVSFEFDSFYAFSPSGYYLLYRTRGFESSKSRLVDVKTGKIFLETFGGVTLNTWTKDKKQFLYGLASEMGSDNGLYITLKGSFPKTKQINEYGIYGGYIDDNYIYVKALIEYGTEKLLIYDVKTLKLVHSQVYK